LLNTYIVGQKFIDYYYGLINNAKPLSPAYVTNNDTYKQAGHVASDICVNGLVLGTPEEFEKVLEKSRTWTNCPSDRVVRYVVESFNSQVLNSDYQFAASRELVDIHGKNDGVRMMLTLSVSGTVYYGVEKHARENTNYMVKKHFNDVFILVPNW